MDFSQILAHRLRSLLASIEGYTDLLTETLATREQRELALRIFEGTHKIERVLADLQTYSRPVSPVLIPVGVGKVLDELSDMLETGDRSRLETIADAERDCWVDADPRMLCQMLLVLVQNGLEAGRGRVRLEVHEENERVHFDVWSEGRIEVEDAGRQVFVPFYTTKAQNLGLGLSIARRMAEAHGGTLDLVATDGAGTCFRLTLRQPED